MSYIFISNSEVKIKEPIEIIFYLELKLVVDQITQITGGQV